MPHVMELKDGRLATPFDYDDFLELVEEYMGHEARRYLEDERCENEGLEKEIEVLNKDYDEMADGYREALNNIREEVEAIETLLDAQRLNRARLKGAVKIIRQMIQNAL